ncbi:hypothetical protein TSTA_110850 [Talaromyces stipitatus ATCC 10500]|uniref:RING-type domain-containing protein n=1 Tax=Talaromyces stipitatus (strain ATCC 10500 / CBS 375.48 / QM 6759 / NRRL 1006) TaxID=441959 RepID=B8MV16_TALSN|nr:uncharacterized protein TSTA_110850 [Talaromyces stipitatus ATCC 10500]EED11906.1 hypothetical protein TSTA_110850 [Talaromyces stipitatus ATCC 10500]
MAQDPSHNLALQLCLEDLNELGHRQKGKQTAGKPTDLELAIASMRDDLLATQKILMSIMYDESVARHDHQLARGIDGEEHEVLDTVGEGNSRQEFDDSDAISTVIGDLMERMHLNSKAVERGTPVRLTPTHRTTKQCGSCLDDTDIFFESACGHGFCRDCIRQLFLGAIKDEELYPPRCCGQIIPPGITLRILTYHELQDFGERAIDILQKIEFTVQSSHVRNSSHLPQFAATMNVLALADTENWMRCLTAERWSSFNTVVTISLAAAVMNFATSAGRCGRIVIVPCGMRTD